MVVAVAGVVVLGLPVRAAHTERAVFGLGQLTGGDSALGADHRPAGGHGMGPLWLVGGSGRSAREGDNRDGRARVQVVVVQ